MSTSPFLPQYRLHFKHFFGLFGSTVMRFVFLCLHIIKLGNRCIACFNLWPPLDHRSTIVRFDIPPSVGENRQNMITGKPNDIIAPLLIATEQG